MKELDKVEIGKSAATAILAGIDSRLIVGGIKSMYPEDSATDIFETILIGISAYLIDTTADTLYENISSAKELGGLGSDFKKIVQIMKDTAIGFGVPAEDLDDIIGNIPTPNVILGQSLQIVAERIINGHE